MDKISLVVHISKDFDLNVFKQKLDFLKATKLTEIVLVQYQNKAQNDIADYPVFSVEDHDDVSFTQLLSAIKTEKFLFFDAEMDYPADFFLRLNTDNSSAEREKEGLWKESLIAVQQSHYGLCGPKAKAKEDFSFLNASVLYNKKEVETLNTDKMNVHPELAVDLYRYAYKKRLSLIYYTPKLEKIAYHTKFADLMMACQKQAQKEFKTFPALFVIFFMIFGIGAYFHPVFFLVFLVGMSAYLLAIILEAFGLSTIKKNGGLVPILLFLFPFIHLVYGLESWMARFKKKK